MILLVQIVKMKMKMNQIVEIKIKKINKLSKWLILKKIKNY